MLHIKHLTIFDNSKEQGIFSIFLLLNRIYNVTQLGLNIAPNNFLEFTLLNKLEKQFILLLCIF